MQNHFPLSIVQTNKKLSLPLFSSKISAGFPSPAEDHKESSLDLHSYLIERPSSSFFLKVKGDSMINRGIHCGDIIVVDKSLQARDNSLVVAVIAGEFLLKRLKIFDKKIELHSENEAYRPIIIDKEQDLIIWGVVVGSVRKYSRI
jgi:DNA polymerase V